MFFYKGIVSEHLKKSNNDYFNKFTEKIREKAKSQEKNTLSKYSNHLFLNNDNNYKNIISIGISISIFLIGFSFFNINKNLITNYYNT